jgi:hypothetical protein
MNRGCHLFGCLPAVIAALAVVVPIRAQFSAAVQGTVRDPQGAAVVGAKVRLTDQGTGVTRETTTSSEGFYRFGEVGPGAHTVTVEATGFSKSVLQNVAVAAELVRGLDIGLEVGVVSQSVTVNGSALPALQSEDASISGTITNRDIERLPQFNRDPYELLRLSPGIFGDDARMGIGGSTGFPNGPGTNGGSGGPGGSNISIFQTENQVPISANGQRVTSNDYIVDGVSVNSLQWGGAAVLTPSAESVEEMTVLSNDYDAADGRSSGAHVKVVTKGGTNDFHGGGFFQYEDPGLNAYNKFNGLNSPDARNNNAYRQFGGNLGGTIVKDKLFFFFNYEGLRDKSFSVRLQRTMRIASRPTRAARAVRLRSTTGPYLGRFWGIMSAGIRPVEATRLPLDWAWSGGERSEFLSRRPGYRSAEARISRASTGCSRA